jgi:hypothetical protein
VDKLHLFFVGNRNKPNSKAPKVTLFSSDPANNVVLLEPAETKKNRETPWLLQKKHGSHGFFVYTARLQGAAESNLCPSFQT